MRRIVPVYQFAIIITMKILTLNTWGGRAGRDALLSFLKQQAADTDIFCLQEISSASHHHLSGEVVGGRNYEKGDVMESGLQEIIEALPEYEYFFHPHYLDNYGLLMLVKKSIPVHGSGDVFVYKEKAYIPEGDVGNHARNIQYLTFERNGSPYTVVNFHGLWNGQGKGDSPDRIAQSKNIVTFLGGITGHVILCGDFNLLPDTQSIKILEESGLRNLVTEHGITTTRTSFYPKQEKFADYIFVSHGDEVKNFCVLPDEVSDHAPLVVEIS